MSFKNGHVAAFEFTLVKTESEWYYGNGTSVVMLDKKANRGALDRQVFDTRYDTTLMADGSNFDEWVDGYLAYRFSGLLA